MTKYRLFGDEAPFSTWLRTNGDLEARSRQIYAMDLDYLIWRFGPGVIFCLEVKTRGGEVRRHQLEVLSILDQAFRKADGAWFETLRGRRRLRFDGVFTLCLGGTSPEDSHWMKLGRAGQKSYTISQSELTAVLGGTDHPIGPANWVAIKQLEEGEEAITASASVRDSAAS